MEDFSSDLFSGSRKPAYNTGGNNIRPYRPPDKGYDGVSRGISRQFDSRLNANNQNAGNISSPTFPSDVNLSGFIGDTSKNNQKDFEILLSNISNTVNQNLGGGVIANINTFSEGIVSELKSKGAFVYITGVSTINQFQAKYTNYNNFINDFDEKRNSLLKSEVVKYHVLLFLHDVLFGGSRYAEYFNREYTNGNSNPQQYGGFTFERPTAGNYNPYGQQPPQQRSAWGNNTYNTYGNQRTTTGPTPLTMTGFRINPFDQPGPGAHQSYPRPSMFDINSPMIYTPNSQQAYSTYDLSDKDKATNLQKAIEQGIRILQDNISKNMVKAEIEIGLNGLVQNIFYLEETLRRFVVGTDSPFVAFVHKAKLQQQDIERKLISSVLEAYKSNKILHGKGKLPPINTVHAM